MTETQHQFPLEGPVTVAVRIPSGDVEIRTADVEEAHVLLSGPSDLLEATTVELHGSTLEIKQRQKGILSRGSHGSLDVEVTVPDGSSVDAVVASADIELRGEFIEVVSKGASGDLEVRGEVFGDVTIKTASGDSEIEHVGGDLRCQSVSGDLTVGALDGSANVTSVSGDVELRSLCDGTVNLTTVSGDVQIGIVRGAGVDVDATTVSGDMSSDVPLSEAPAEAAGGATVVVRARTVSGDLQIVRAPERESLSA